VSSGRKTEGVARARRMSVRRRVDNVAVKSLSYLPAAVNGCVISGVVLVFEQDFEDINILAGDFALPHVGDHYVKARDL